MRGTLLGLSRKEIENRIKDLADFTGLGDYLHMPTRTYSSGMRVRLAFAISAAIDPEILLMDEVFSVGDANFIEKAQQKIISLLSNSSIVIMANHSEKTIRKFCNKALLLDSGTIKFFGPVDDAYQLYEENRKIR